MTAIPCRSPGSRSWLLLLWVFLPACSDLPSSSPAGPVLRQAAPLATPRSEMQAPSYPAIAVYIVYREYVIQNPGLRRLDPDDARYQRYMEKRLRELYPQRGYAGMMKDAVAEFRAYRQRWNEHAARSGVQIGVQACESVMSIASTGGCEGEVTEPSPPFPEYEDDPSWADQQEFVVDEAALPTLPEEADTLQLTADENELLHHYEDLAVGNEIHISGADGLTRDDLIRLAAAGGTPGESGAQFWGPWITVPLGIAAYFGPRILFARLRAEHASASYYPDLNPGDTRRDAFRHVYVNVMLRRYCSGPIAKLVMDVNEWGNDTWGARVMDEHNNDIGRDVKYRHFRGHWLWDRWSWGVWGHRVRRYIDDPQNGTFIEALQSTTLTEYEARRYEQPVPARSYIFFR